MYVATHADRFQRVHLLARVPIPTFACVFKSPRLAHTCICMWPRLARTCMQTAKISIICALSFKKMAVVLYLHNALLLICYFIIHYVLLI